MNVQNIVQQIEKQTSLSQDALELVQRESFRKDVVRAAEFALTMLVHAPNADHPVLQLLNDTAKGDVGTDEAKTLLRCLEAMQAAARQAASYCAAYLATEEGEYVIHGISASTSQQPWMPPEFEGDVLQHPRKQALFILFTPLYSHPTIDIEYREGTYYTGDVTTDQTEAQIQTYRDGAEEVFVPVYYNEWDSAISRTRELVYERRQSLFPAIAALSRLVLDMIWQGEQRIDAATLEQAVRPFLTRGAWRSDVLHHPEREQIGTLLNDSAHLYDACLLGAVRRISVAGGEPVTTAKA